MRYRIDPDWRDQLSFSRVVTDCHRDSDILLTGVGEVFQDAMPGNIHKQISS